MPENLSPSLNVARRLVREFAQRHPAETAHYLDSLPPADIARLLSALPPVSSAHLLSQLNRDRAIEVLQLADDAAFSSLLAHMDPSQVSLLLSRFTKKVLDEKLTLLPPGLSRELTEMMAYPPETAGALMDPRVTTFSGDVTVGEALREIRRIKARRIVDVCLVDRDNCLTALVSLQSIAVADLDTTLRELADGNPPRVDGLAPTEDVVELMDRKKLASLPVVDTDGRLLGIIPYDALVSAAQQDASEDVQAMFGAGRDEKALGPVLFAVRKRLPWLNVNLVTAFIAASVVGFFEDTIAQLTMLAVFLPVVAGQSGNTGSQAMAVALRGLALREIRPRQWLRILRKEMTVGLINGLAMALTAGLVVGLWSGSLPLAGVIAGAMVLSLLIACMAGSLIPLILKAVGQDPASSSSIFLTTITDICGFFFFLGLAKIFSNALLGSIS